MNKNFLAIRMSMLCYMSTLCVSTPTGGTPPPLERKSDFFASLFTDTQRPLSSDELRLHLQRILLYKLIYKPTLTKADSTSLNLWLATPDALHYHVLSQVPNNIRKYFKTPQRATIAETEADELSIIQSQSVLHLSLAHNGFMHLPKSVGELSELETLDLSCNNFERVPECLKNLSNLRELNLNNNQLSKLPDWLATLPNLRILRISNNLLTGLPTVLTTATHLEKIYISGNRIEKLPRSCQALSDKLDITILNNGQKI